MILTMLRSQTFVDTEVSNTDLGMSAKKYDISVYLLLEEILLAMKKVK